MWVLESNVSEQTPLQYSTDFLCSTLLFTHKLVLTSGALAIGKVMLATAIRIKMEMQVKHRHAR